MCCAKSGDVQHVCQGAKVKLQSAGHTAFERSDSSWRIAVPSAPPGLNLKSELGPGDKTTALRWGAPD